MKFKIIDDLTSDEYYEAYGKDLRELFENAATGMFTIMCRIERIKPRKGLPIEVTGRDAKDLLYNWLTRLIACVDGDEMFLSKFEISEIDEHHVKAIVYGDAISSETGNLGVKAITNYKFDLIREKEGYKATIAVDV